MWSARHALYAAGIDTIQNMDTCTRMTITYQPDSAQLREMLSADETEKARYRVYPNPSSSEARVAWTQPEGGTATLEVFNATGAIMLERKLENAEGTEAVNVSNWSAGVYICKVTAENGKVFVHKLIVIE